MAHAIAGEGPADPEAESDSGARQGSKETGDSNGEDSSAQEDELASDKADARLDSECTCSTTAIHPSNGRTALTREERALIKAVQEGHGDNLYRLVDNLKVVLRSKWARLVNQAKQALDDYIEAASVKTRPSDARSLSKVSTTLTDWLAGYGLPAAPISSRSIYLYACKAFANIKGTAAWDLRSRRKVLSYLEDIRKVANGPFKKDLADFPQCKSTFFESVQDTLEMRGLETITPDKLAQVQDSEGSDSGSDSDEGMSSDEEVAQELTSAANGKVMPGTETPRTTPEVQKATLKRKAASPLADVPAQSKRARSAGASEASRPSPAQTEAIIPNVQNATSITDTALAAALGPRKSPKKPNPLPLPGILLPKAHGDGQSHGNQQIASRRENSALETLGNAQSNATQPPPVSGGRPNSTAPHDVQSPAATSKEGTEAVSGVCPPRHPEKTSFRQRAKSPLYPPSARQAPSVAPPVPSKGQETAAKSLTPEVGHAQETSTQNEKMGTATASEVTQRQDATVDTSVTGPTKRKPSPSRVIDISSDEEGPSAVPVVRTSARPQISPPPESKAQSDAYQPPTPVSVGTGQPVGATTDPRNFDLWDSTFQQLEKAVTERLPRQADGVSEARDARLYAAVQSENRAASLQFVMQRNQRRMRRFLSQPPAQAPVHGNVSMQPSRAPQRAVSVPAAPGPTVLQPATSAGSRTGPAPPGQANPPSVLANAQARLPAIRPAPPGNIAPVTASQIASQYTVPFTLKPVFPNFLREIAVPNLMTGKFHRSAISVTQKQGKTRSTQAPAAAVASSSDVASRLANSFQASSAGAFDATAQIPRPAPMLTVANGSMSHSNSTTHPRQGTASAISHSQTMPTRHPLNDTSAGSAGTSSQLSARGSATLSDVGPLSAPGPANQTSQQEGMASSNPGGMSEAIASARAAQSTGFQGGLVGPSRQEASKARVYVGSTPLPVKTSGQPAENRPHQSSTGSAVNPAIWGLAGDPVPKSTTAQETGASPAQPLPFPLPNESTTSHRPLKVTSTEISTHCEDPRDRLHYSRASNDVAPQTTREQSLHGRQPSASGPLNLAPSSTQGPASLAAGRTNSSQGAPMGSPIAPTGATNPAATASSPAGAPRSSSASAPSPQAIQAANAQHVQTSASNGANQLPRYELPSQQALQKSQSPTASVQPHHARHPSQVALAQPPRRTSSPLATTAPRSASLPGQQSSKPALHMNIPVYSHDGKHQLVQSASTQGQVRYTAPNASANTSAVGQNSTHLPSKPLRNSQAGTPVQSPQAQQPQQMSLQDQIFIQQQQINQLQRQLQMNQQLVMQQQSPIQAIQQQWQAHPQVLSPIQWQPRNALEQANQVGSPIAWQAGNSQGPQHVQGGQQPQNLYQAQLPHQAGFAAQQQPQVHYQAGYPASKPYQQQWQQPQAESSSANAAGADMSRRISELPPNGATVERQNVLAVAKSPTPGPTVEQMLAAQQALENVAMMYGRSGSLQQINDQVEFMRRAKFPEVDIEIFKRRAIFYMHNRQA